MNAIHASLSTHTQNITLSREKIIEKQIKCIGMNPLGNETLQYLRQRQHFPGEWMTIPCLILLFTTCRTQNNPAGALNDAYL